MQIKDALSRPRMWLVALAGPAVITSLSLFEGDLSTTTAALLFVLAVVVAAGLEGPPAGAAASFFSFLALNFFFTPPLHTFAADKMEDLIALVIFLMVSVITGLLLSTAVRERRRAEMRERQTRLINRSTTQLLAGRSLEEVLRELAEGMVGLMELAECSIVTEGAPTIRVTTARRPASPVEIPLSGRGERPGTLTATPSAARGLLTRDERALIEALAGQVSLALESTRLVDEVRSAQLEAETNKLRAALFSGVTHDLKTPLSAITASVTSLLEGSTFTEEQRYEHLDTIRQEAGHLDRVVTNLMDLARLRAGALVPARVPASIDELIEAVVARLQPLLAGRETHLDLHDELPEMSIDVIQIDQVLTNVIENAVKFSPQGTPIRISATGGREKVRVTVSDRGPGIPHQDRERIFNAFERGNGEVTGTGLGLAIAWAAVRAHGGRMWAQDSPGGGAAVTFELPTSEGAGS